jgi:hypothetical protein
VRNSFVFIYYDVYVESHTELEKMPKDKAKGIPLYVTKVPGGEEV